MPHELAELFGDLDESTRLHSLRVADLCEAMARQAGWSDERIRAVRTAALLHDIGKLAVPSGILFKPGPLTDREKLIVMTHPQAGFEVVSDFGLPADICHAVLAHHVNADGSGYPHVAPDTLSSLLHVADVYDAITSERCYRHPAATEKAVRYMLDGAGTLFDEKWAKGLARLESEREKGL